MPDKTREEVYNEAVRLHDKCDTALSGQALGNYIMSVRQRGKKYAYQKFVEHMFLPPQTEFKTSSHIINFGDNMSEQSRYEFTLDIGDMLGSLSNNEPDSILLGKYEHGQVGLVYLLDPTGTPGIRFVMKVPFYSDVLFVQDMITSLTIGSTEYLQGDASFSHGQELEGLQNTYCVEWEQYSGVALYNHTTNYAFDIKIPNPFYETPPG